MNRLSQRIDPVVFWGSAVLLSAFVAWGLFALQRDDDPDTRLTLRLAVTEGWWSARDGLAVATGVANSCAWQDIV